MHVCGNSRRCNTCAGEKGVQAAVKTIKEDGYRGEGRPGRGEKGRGREKGGRLGKGEEWVRWKDWGGGKRQEEGGTGQEVEGSVG